MNKFLNVWNKNWEFDWCLNSEEVFLLAPMMTILSTQYEVLFEKDYSSTIILNIFHITFIHCLL